MHLKQPVSNAFATGSQDYEMRQTNRKLRPTFPPTATAPAEPVQRSPAVDSSFRVAIWPGACCVCSAGSAAPIVS